MYSCYFIFYYQLLRLVFYHGLIFSTYSSISSIIGITAIGTTFVIIGGGFDISVESLLALTTAMSVGLQHHIHLSLAVSLVLIIEPLVVFNGFSGKMHIPPIITTLCTMIIIRGLTYLYTGGYLAYVKAPDFIFIGAGYLGLIPFPIIIFIIN